MQESKNDCQNSLFAQKKIPQPLLTVTLSSPQEWTMLRSDMVVHSLHQMLRM